MKPIIAIVGRPNVGKSRLFNRIVGQRRAIVADEPGVTRDRHYADAEWCGRPFIAVDTGGLDLDPHADLEGEISKQSLFAIEEADVVVCVFDGQRDPTPDDRDVIAMMRKSQKPVLCAVNKVDEAVHESMLGAYYEAGLTELFPVSAEHGRGVDDLLERVMKLLPQEALSGEEVARKNPIAVVGRPNVGKSTLINRLAGENRVVVHEMAGTTRDAIDVEIEFEGRIHTFIDTAGVKKRWGVSERLEKFTAMRSLRTVNRSNVVIQLIDGREGMTKQDMHLTGFVVEEGKGLILLVNKWDLVQGDWKKFEDDLRHDLGQLGDVPILPVSAKTGSGCLKIFSELAKMEDALAARVGTAELNRILEEALARHHLPAHKGKQVTINYATQTGTHPPTFMLFSNFPAAVPYTYRRYLVNRLKEAIGARGVPVKIVCRRK
jgi:GTP-binding protein